MRRILFNGAILYRPGAATRIDASRFQVLSLSGVGAVALIGPADDGAPNILKTFTDVDSLRSYYRSGPLVEAANAVAKPSKDPRITAGASLIAAVKVNQSTQANYQALTSAANAMLIKSKGYGLPANMLSYAIAAGPTTGRIVTLKDRSVANARTEVSPELGASGKMTVRYVGTGASATLTLSATGFVVTTDVPADDINIPWTSVRNLTDLISIITSKAAYTATALVANAASFNPANLDYTSALDVRTALTTLYSRNFDVLDWINTQSQTHEATRSAGAYPIGATWPDVVTEKTLGTAVAGATTNTHWLNALAKLGTVNVQQVIPCISKDGTGDDASTIASVAAAVEAHCRLYSATGGGSERQGWLGVAMSKTNLIAQAVALNSEHVCLSGMQPQVLFTDGTLDYGDEYLLAALLAGMRAGAPLGEPLTWKFPNCISVKVRDASWDPDNNTDAVDLLNNGIIYARNVPQKGVRIERGLTTFLKLENDAYIEESIVQGWKNIARELRRGLEDKFVGSRALLANILGAVPTAYAVLDKLRDEGQIADSYINGETIPGFGNFRLTYSSGAIRYSVEASPVEGVIWILNDLFLVPSRVSL